MSDVFQFPSVDARDKRVTVFQTPLPKERPEAEIQRMAERFAVHGKTQDKGSRIVVQNSRSRLELFHASDSVWWTALGTGREPVRGVKLPEEGDAIKAADAYLRRMEMADRRAGVRSVTYTELARVEKDHRDRGESKRIAMHVNYGFTLDDLPVLGPGAKMQVTFAGRDKVSEAYKFWREPKADRDMEIIGPDEAIALFRRDPIFADLCEGQAQVIVRRIRMGYYAMPPREAQERLLPVYAFEGTVSTPALEGDQFVRYLSAVRMSAPEAKRSGMLIGNGSPVLQAV